MINLIQHSKEKMNKAIHYTLVRTIILSLCLFVGQSASADPKYVALIIGNQNYHQLPILKNPTNDANDISNKLKTLGFAVDKLLDADHQTMENAIRQFANSLNDKNTVGLFYFAGHGVQVRNRNYLIPIASGIKSEADVRYKSVDVGQLLEHMEYAENNLNLVILDACRDNPFGGQFRSARRGLAKTDVVPKGSMILYAASPGQQAEDGEGRNGLFTEKLLQVMKQPGLTVDQVINKTAQAVNKASASGQVPYKEGIILSDFYFTGPVTMNQPTIQVAGVDPDVASKAENRFWDSVIADPSHEMYEAYLKEYPTGYYSRIAKIKLRKLERQALLKPIPAITTGQLMIRSNVSGDNVTLNGESKGSTQLDLKLKPGIYALEVSKKGYESWERTIDIKAGSEQVVYAKLKETAVVSSGTSKTLPKNGSHRTRTIRDSVTGMELVKVPKGCFQMGSNGSSKNDRPGHKVCITKDFYLGKYEVTQGQWEAIMGNNPSKLKTGNDHPVEQVSWYDVQEYIRKLNAKTGKTYRLPTEAEWEFACRSGGKDQEFCGGNHLSTYGWYGEDPKNGHHKVGGKLPNGIGLYDMSGNVWEWTCSLYKPSYNDFEKRCGNDSGNRSLRGGSWYYKPDSLRSDARGWGKPVSFRSDVGFRLFLLQSG